MPHWLVIGLFVSIVAALAVIVRWEFKRVGNAPYDVAVKRYIDSQNISPRSHVRKEIKRGLDRWD